MSFLEVASVDVLGSGRGGHDSRRWVTLRTLSVNAGRVVTSKSLLCQVWAGREPTDTERAFVKQLRAKLGDPAARPAWIFYEHGVGYRMGAPGDG